MSQEEANVEQRRCNKEISCCSENLAIVKEILVVTCTIWTTIGKNLCFLDAGRILLTAALKHEANTPKNPETLRK